ncbi:MAG: hypothetical protein O2820_07375 [Planctomycetota bacterium]|nr:hypothetical protein [Planctomycetota bacterium]
MMSLRARLIIFAAAAFSIGMFWLTDIPLGISGEWTWDRIEQESGTLALLGAIQAAIFFAVFALVAWAGSKQIAAATRTELAGWLLALIAAGFGWLHAVQETPPSGWDSAKIPFVMYYPSSSGYFYKAEFEVDDTTKFLRDYESIVREGDVLHEGTHPPGLVVLFRGLIRLAEMAPSLASLPEAVMPESAAEGFDFIREKTAGTPRALSRRGESVIWLAAMLTQLAGVAVVVPLFLLIRLTLDRETAWRMVSFWPLLPALAIFIPKSDVLFSFGSSLLVCTWLYAVRAASIRNSSLTPLVLGALAGLIGWLGLFCSLAFLPSGAIAVLASVLLFRTPSVEVSSEAATERSAMATQLRWSAKLHWKPALGGFVSFAVLTTLVAIVWDLNLPRVWQLNYANHARFYEVSPRSWLGWLLVNPVELVLAIGVPVSLMLFSRRGSAVDAESASGQSRASGCPHSAVTLAVGTVWGLLWLTGKNSGEAARLWIPLMPMALWVGAAAWNQPKSATTQQSLDGNARRGMVRDWLIVLTVQAVVCLLTVLRVSGFLKERGLIE